MIQFNPRKGTILRCDFSTGFQPPEMVKKRPVIVITPRQQGGSPLCTVVPLSTKEPSPVLSFHHKMEPHSLPETYRHQDCWAKCDMIYTVSYARLDRFRIRDANGQRRWVQGRATRSDIEAIEKAVLNGLGLRKFLT